MKKGDVIRQKCVNTTFYLTGILAHKVNNSTSRIFCANNLPVSLITLEAEENFLFC